MSCDHVTATIRPDSGTPVVAEYVLDAGHGPFIVVRMGHLDIMFKDPTVIDSTMMALSLAAERLRAAIAGTGASAPSSESEAAHV